MTGCVIFQTVKVEYRWFDIFHCRSTVNITGK